MFQAVMAELARSPVATVASVFTIVSSALAIFLGLLAMRKGSSRNTVDNGIARDVRPAQDFTSLLLANLLTLSVAAGFALFSAIAFDPASVGRIAAFLLLYCVACVFISLCVGAILSDWVIHSCFDEGELAAWIQSEDRRRRKRGAEHKSSSIYRGFFLTLGVTIAIAVWAVFWAFQAEALYTVLAAESAGEDSVLGTYGDPLGDTMGWMVASLLFSCVFGAAACSSCLYAPIESRVRNSLRQQQSNSSNTTAGSAVR